MQRTVLALLIGVALVLAACKTNNDPKPVYYRFTDATQQA